MKSHNEPPDLIVKFSALNEIFHEYLNAKRAEGNLFPIKFVGSKPIPDMDLICTEISEKFHVHIRTRSDSFKWFKSKLSEVFLNDLITEKTNLTAEQKKELKLAQKQRYLFYEQKLKSFLQISLENKQPLKRIWLSRRIDLVWLSEVSQIPLCHLTNPNTLAYRLLANSPAKIEIEQDIDFSEKRRITFKELRVFGHAQRALEVANNKSAYKQVCYTRHALNKFLDANQLCLASFINLEFGIQFDQCLKKLGQSISNSKTRKKVFNEVRKWRGYYSQFAKTGYLPDRFGDALKYLLDTHKTPSRKLNELDELSSNVMPNIYNWINNICYPGIGSLPLIEKLEKFFKLAEGTLSSKSKFKCLINLSKVIQSFSLIKFSASEKLILRKQLPKDFASLNRNLQEDMLLILREQFDNNVISYRKIIGKALAQPYALKVFPARLESEISKFVDFKTAFIAGDGYQRKKDAKWKVNPSRKGSVDRFLSQCGSFFGALSVSRTINGAGIELPALTITLLTSPNAWSFYIEFMKSRLGYLPAESCLALLGTVITNLDPQHGWISQTPELSETLAPVAEFASVADIFQAQSNWKQFLAIQKLKLEQIKDALENHQAQSPRPRDAFLPILPILEANEPLLIVKEAFDFFADNISSPLPNKFNKDKRDLIYLKILFESGLRRANMIELTWNSNNTGHLRRNIKGYYSLHIPAENFKNYQSSYFGPRGNKQPYYCQLSKSLTLHLDAYLGEIRPTMIDKFKMAFPAFDFSQQADRLFLNYNNSKPNFALTVSSANYIVLSFSSSYLVYNPITKTGVKGVYPFGNHAARHIIATHIYKTTRSAGLAADAIHDTESTVINYYGRFVPQERDQEISKIRSKIFDS